MVAAARDKALLSAVWLLLGVAFLAFAALVLFFIGMMLSVASVEAAKAWPGGHVPRDPIAVARSWVGPRPAGQAGVQTPRIRNSDVRPPLATAARRPL